jgi:hypothetical protein
MRTGDDSKMLIYSRCQRIHGWHVVALSESRVLNGADRHQPAVPEQSVCASQKHYKILKSDLALRENRSKFVIWDSKRLHA